MAAESLAVDLPFIGRVDELALLERVLQGAMSGHPRVLLISGDAGIGKSRLVAEASAAAKAAGATILLGTCHEGVAIPYLPVATAFRRLDHPGARRLDPTTRLPEQPAAAAEDLQLQVFLAATAALIDTAKAGPTVLVVEDVHWADEGSAELLRHLVLASMHEAGAAGLPLLAILTAREPWPGGVPTVLARLPREEVAVELHLDHFGVLEAHAMVSALTGSRPRTDVTNGILEVTAGNPLLMRGVITRNLASGRLAISGGEVRLAGDLPLRAPTDLDEEIRIRLSKVGASCQAMLLLAAVLGDGGDVTALRAACEGDIAGALAEASEAGLLRVGSPRYRFAHPQVRQVLYHDLDGDAQAAAHLRIARAVEDLPTIAEADRALTIAHHLRLGGADAQDERVARWALRAGDQAWAAGAWADAQGAYALALGGAAPHTLAPEDLTEVLLRTGVAAYYANEDSSPRWLEQAADLARDRGDVTRWAEALLLRARFHLIGSAATVGAPAPVEELEVLLDSLGDRPGLQARALATLSDLHFVGLDHDRAAAFAKQAEAALDVQVDDTDAVARVAFVLGLQELAAVELTAARRHFSQVIEHGDDHIRLAAETRIGLTHLVGGNLDDAFTALARARRGERELSSHAGQQLPSAALASIHVLRGAFAEAERLAAEVIALYAIQEYAFTPGLVFPTLAAARVGRGDVDGAQQALGDWRACGGRGTWRYEALVRALAGDAEAVAHELHARPWPSIAGSTLVTLDIPCLHVAVGAAIGDPELIRSGLPELAAAHDRGVVVALGWPWVLSRLLGDGYAELGELAAAERWYHRAEADASHGGAVVERAQVALGRARVALAQGRADDAASGATQSATDLDAVDALLLARTARGVVERSGGAEPPKPRDRVILFTDIVGSTQLNVRAGDEQYVPLLKEHDRILRARLRRHDGVEYTHTGDGMSAWFTSAASAITCAFGMQADLERAANTHPELPVRVRMGISAGRPVDTGEGLFGVAVVTSARICALAGAGQVFVSDEVRRSADRVCAFGIIGERELKGIPGTPLIYEALDLRDR